MLFLYQATLHNAWNFSSLFEMGPLDHFSAWFLFHCFCFLFILYFIGCGIRFVSNLTLTIKLAQMLR